MSAADRATRDELRDLVELYARLADRHDGRALSGLFTVDAKIEIFDRGIAEGEPTRVLDRDGIAAEISALDLFRATLHFLGQQHVEADGDDRARGETYCEASHVFADDEGALVNHVVALRYFDDYVRVGPHWRFARRRLDFAWVEQRPVATDAQLANIPGRPSIDGAVDT